LIGRSQTIGETAAKFWEAVNTPNDQEIILNGNILMDYFEQNSFALDTTVIGIRLFTAISYSNRGQYENALNLNLKSLELIDVNWGKGTFYYYITLNFIADNYSEMGDYSKSLEYNLRALEIVEKSLGKEHPDYALSLSNIARNYSKMGAYSKSLEYNLRALEMVEKSLGKEHPDYALSLSNIASNYSKMGAYSKSLEYNLKALEIYEKSFGKEHPDYAMSLINIALNYHEMGDYSKSLEYNLKALEIMEKSLGKEHPNYAVSLSNIALNYHEMGAYSKSLEYNLKALDIREKSLGKEHPSYAESLNYIASNYSKMGAYSKSLEYNLKALDIKERSLGKEHPGYAGSLNNISENYYEMGDYSKALEYNLKALGIWEKSLGKEHPSYTGSLNNIAVNYSKIGDYSKSLEYNLKALDIREKSLGKEHPDYAMSLNNIAMDYSIMGDYSKSLEYNFKALDIREKFFGKEHPDYAMSLINIALNYSDMGDYSKSLEYNLKALDIREKSLGKEHPSYAGSLNHIASNYSKMGDYSTVSKCLREAYSITEVSYAKNKYGLNAELLAKYKEGLNLEFLFNASILPIDTTNLPFANKAWINLNGQIGSNSQQLEQNITEIGDTLLFQILEDLKNAKKRLTVFNELTLQEKEQRGINQQVLEDDITAMERELIEKSQAFADFNRYFYPSDVTKELNENEFFVDVARIPYYSFYSNKWTDSIKYLVFITDSKDTLVDYVFIENGLELEKELISDYKLESSQKNTATDLKNEIFYNSFWKPIADKIGDSKIVYVSLGGVYNNINLNTIYNPETGKYLLEEKDIRIVNSARDFVLSKEREKKPYTSTNSALYGFPDFNGNTTKTVDSTDFLASTRDLDQMWIDSLTRGGMKASPLPATKVEVEQIAGTFQKNGWSVKTYTGETASETNIKLEESPRVLHVATHGYFFEDIPMDKSNDRFLGMDRQRVVQDPMLRSGLLFTGANKTLQGELVNGENGLLSAAEASLLDLRETELVVLSACETGKGELKNNSEGVYGLRKAFSDAGAQNIIMSLWKVDDKVTQEFMSRFYEIWLNEKTTIREAFNRTQLEIKAKYPQPYYWGAFILVGE